MVNNYILSDIANSLKAIAEVEQERLKNETEGLSDIKTLLLNQNKILEEIAKNIKIFS